MEEREGNNRKVKGNKFVKKIFVGVIGWPSSGKSTIIKSLTGCKNSSFRGIVKDKNTGESVCVCCASPQETTFELKRLKEWMRTCFGDKTSKGIVMAIQPNKPTRRVRMEQIYQWATYLGYDSYAFVIDPGYNPYRNQFPNTILSDVYNRLTSVSHPPISLSHPPIQLNGERFAFWNAQIIQKRSHIL